MCELRSFLLQGSMVEEKVLRVSIMVSSASASGRKVIGGRGSLSWVLDQDLWALVDGLCSQGRVAVATQLCNPYACARIGYQQERACRLYAEGIEGQSMAVPLRSVEERSIFGGSCRLATVGAAAGKDVLGDRMPVAG